MRADLADEMARRLVWPQVASHGEDRLQVTFGGLLDLRFVSRNRAKVPRKVRPVLDVGQDIQEVACREFAAKSTLQGNRRRGDRSEERRVGKECVSTCRSRWSPYH